MRRELIETLPNGDMLVIDISRDVFGKPSFTAGKIVTEMRPAMVFRTIGTFETKTEAAQALSAGQRQEGGG